MNITKSQVERVLLSKIKGLDPIAVFLIDHSKEQGSIIITCCGQAWTAFWAAMGKRNVADFVLSCDKYYLAGSLSSVSSTAIDYDRIGRKIGHDVEITTMAYFDAELVDAYGPDWRMDIPTKPNHEYEYLCRIILAVQQGLVTVLQQQER